MTLVPVKTHIIESACRAAIKQIDNARLANKIEQVDLLMKDEQSIFEKILGHKPAANRDEAEKELMQYAEKKNAMPENEFVWIHYKKEELDKANLLLDSCHLAADGIIWLGLEDVRLVNQYLKIT